MAAKVQGTKTRQATKIQEEGVLASVKDMSLDSVSQSITQTQLEVQRVLADLTAKVMERLQDLQNVEGAIQLRTDELARINQIKVTATTLDELEAQIKETRTNWEQEQLSQKKLIAEQNSERTKLWAREDAEHRYVTDQNHRKEQDALDYDMQQQKKANTEKQQQLDKLWAEREGELKKREQEVVELRAFKDQAPDMIKKAANAEVAVATNSVKKEYETKMLLAAKDHDVEKRLADQQVQSLNQNNARLQQQIDELKSELQQAHMNAKEIAGKALDSASGRATTEALQRMMEKEQGSSKTTK